VVEGDVSGQQADIMGKVTGTIKVKELLQLKSNCQVNGNLYSAKLQIEPAATFNGQCHMMQEEPKNPNSGKSNPELRKDGFQKTPSLAIS
jgi:cytoskeletal protein CcmA (bactofilin family)